MKERLARIDKELQDKYQGGPHHQQVAYLEGIYKVLLVIAERQEDSIKLLAALAGNQKASSECQTSSQSPKKK